MNLQNSLNNNTSLDQYVMVFEKSNIALDVKKDSDNKYILEGVFAQFGVENNNHRIYEETDYLPHLEYLNEMIAKNKLLGELDHPERFDVSLNNVSHIVEHLEYDKANRELRGRIKILDTPKGRICKTLIDAGISLGISSRSAGIVESNKKVKLKRIFTYDIVKDPGMEKSNLYSVNESLQLITESSVLDFFNGSKGLFDTMTLVNESFGLNETSNIQIYNTDSNKDLQKLLEGDKNNVSKMDNNKFVTVEEMNNYSVVVKNEIESIKNSIKESLSSRTDENKDAVIAELNEKIEVLETYIKYVAENVDKNISYSKYLAKNQDKGISYIKHIAENVDQNITYTKYLAEHQDKGISYMKYLAENQDKTISFTQHLADVSKKLNEELEVNVGYLDYIKSEINEKTIIETAKVEETQVVEAAKTEEAPKAEEIAAVSENTNTENTDTLIVEVAKVEETQVVAPKVDYLTLSDKVQKLTESIKKQKTDSLIAEKNYKFLPVLSPDNQNAFLALDETKKQKVSKAVNEGQWTNEVEVLSIIEATLNDTNGQPNFIANMPEKYKSAWEALNENEKNVIIAQSRISKLETSYQIKAFWDTRKLIPTVGLVTESKNYIDAEKTSKKNENQSNLGYSSEYIKSIGSQLKSRF